MAHEKKPKQQSNVHEDVLISLVTRDVHPKTLARAIDIRKLENAKRVRRTFMVSTESSS